jgi:hypothetical protein
MSLKYSRGLRICLYLWLCMSFLFKNIMCVFVYYLYRMSVLFYITYNSVHVFVLSFSLSYYYSFFYKYDYTMYSATYTYI